MKKAVNDVNLIAKCGLYCGSCRKYLKDNCPGCLKNEKASWCKVRSCTIIKNISSCADCDEFINPMECKKYNNFMAKLFGFVFNSDRSACIQKIKKIGYEKFALEMSEKEQMTIKEKNIQN